MEEWSFETLAASLKADIADLHTFHEVLATKLERSLGQAAVQIKRGGWPWQEKRPLIKLSVELASMRWEVERAASGMTYKMVKLVRGVALKSEMVPLETWLEALSKALWEHANASQATREALERFLLDQ